MVMLVSQERTTGVQNFNARQCSVCFLFFAQGNWNTYRWMQIHLHLSRMILLRQSELVLWFIDFVVKRIESRCGCIILLKGIEEEFT